MLVTSRPYGLSEGQQQQLGLPHVPLAELTTDLQRLLVQRWFHCLRDDAAEARSVSDELWADVTARPEIARLAGNPLLLTAMCIVYGENRKLPQDEFDLYDRIVNTVLFHRFPERSNEAATARSRLCVIAHGMHTGEGLGETRDQPRPEATVDEIDRMLQFYQNHRPGSELHKVHALQARDELLSQSGLLLPQGDDQRAAFYHFTFQDFLAAERLYDVHSNELPSVFRQRGQFNEWRKALGLLFGALLHKRSTPDHAIVLLSELVASLRDDDLRLGVVLADCLNVLRGHGQSLDIERQKQFVDFCVRAAGRATPLKERVELALALGRLGDPRVAKDLNDPSAWVSVPPGEYRIGDEVLAKKIKKERSWWTSACLPDEVVVIPSPYQITKYPITNAQFGAFVKAGGYAEQSWWHPEGWKWREEQGVTEPALWRDAKWNGATQPVVGVTWWEADAFCRWAGCRLPTEREWEAAARGHQGRAFPWGNEWRTGICNSAEAELGVTTPVGIFPDSAAECGAHDMAGNVWEWCGDQFDSGRAGDAHAGRVLRGGSWYNYLHLCRSAVRDIDHPGDRNIVIGFRAART